MRDESTKKKTGKPRIARSHDGFIRSATIRWDKVESRDVYPWTLPVFRNMVDLPLHPHMTIFVGENGSGKSTIMEGIAEAAGINSEGGSRNHSFATTEHRSPVAPYLRLVRGTRREQTEFFLRGESLYNVLTAYQNMPLDQPEPFRFLHYKSHGEGFLRLVMERFGNNGLYFLDEPESALSPQNLLTLICRMHQLAEAGSQFIIATHSPIIMAYPDALVYQLNSEGLSPVNYRETEHYRITKRFLEDPESFLRSMLDHEKGNG